MRGAISDNSGMSSSDPLSPSPSCAQPSGATPSGEGVSAASLLALVQGIIQGLLSPLLDPLVNVLLKALGIDLAQTEVGARMTCGVHPELVF